MEFRPQGPLTALRQLRERVALAADALTGKLARVLEEERTLRAEADRERARSVALLETMTDGYVTLSPDWRVVEANRKAEQILNMPRAQLIGRNAFELFPQAVGTSIHSGMARAISDHAPIEFEDYYPPAQRWYEVRMYPRDRLFSVFFRDITRRRQTQDAVRFQTRLLDSLGQAVIATNLDGRIIYWNQPAEALLGWRASEVVDRAPITTTQHQQSAEENRRLHARIRAGTAWAGEAQLLRKQGELFAAALSDTPIRDDRGAVIGMVRIITDLTERKSIEEQQRFLAEAGAALASELDAEGTSSTVARLAVPTLADCCIVDLVEEDGSIRRVETVHVNPGKENIIRELSQSYPVDETSRHPVAEVVRTRRPRLIGRVNESVLRSIARDQRHMEMLHEMAFESGMVLPLLAHGRILGTITLLLSESGRRYGKSDLNVAEELARRAASAIENARLYEAAIIASRAKSDFLAVMSHELRTPLTTIMGYTDLLLAGVPRPLEDAPLRYIDRIRTAAWHLLGIIEQILIYARIDLGREKLQPQQLNVATLVRETVALIEPVAAEKEIDFEVQTPPEVIIETDATKVRQVLLNLLSNAIKFTDQGRVGLATTVQDNTVTFEVSDTGIGIAPEHLEHIFDPFWQVDQSATRNVGGTGLGLAVVRRLARLLGGDVHARSAPGSGAIFTVQLPLKWRN